jgi:hypothetical protein
MARLCSILLHNRVPYDSMVLMLSLPCAAHHQTPLDMPSLSENAAGAARNGGHCEPPPSGVDQPLFVKLGELVSVLVKSV